MVDWKVGVSERPITAPDRTPLNRSGNTSAAAVVSFKNDETRWARPQWGSLVSLSNQAMKELKKKKLKGLKIQLELFNCQELKLLCEQQQNCNKTSDYWLPLTCSTAICDK